MLVYEALIRAMKCSGHDNSNNQECSNMERKETPEQCKSSSVSFNISSGFNYLNVIKTTGDYDGLENSSIHETKFKSFADENFIEVKPFTNGNSMFPFNCQVPYGIARYNMVNNYMKFQDHPSENIYLCKTRDQVLGNIAKSHMFNNPTKDDVVNMLKHGYDYEKMPVMWTPISRNRKTLNKAVQESDYSRFIYHCSSYDSDLDPMRIEDKSSSNNGLKYWYKDSSNYPSTIRPLILSDFISKYSKWATISDPSKWHSFTSPLQRATPTELDSRILKMFKDKIIVIEHRRINLTSTDSEKNCPILGYYIRQGWKLSEDANDLNPIETIFKDIDNILSKNPTNNHDDIDRGFYTESSFPTGEYIGGVLEKEQHSKSVCLTKTTIIDIDKSGLRDTDGVYVSEVDLVIGKMKIVKDHITTYPMDYLHHPNSREGSLARDDLSEHIELLYVNNNSPRNKPLYSNTHGLITKLYPTNNVNYSDGLYVIRKRNNNIEDVVKVDESSRINYGIFNTLEDAKVYSQVNDEFLKNLNGMYKDQLHDAKIGDAIALEKLKSQYAKDQFERNLEMEEMNREIKRIEQETKIRELVYKVELLDRELKKHEYVTLSSTVTGVMKNIVEIGGVIVKSLQMNK